jgi:hypothetical protein
MARDPMSPAFHVNLCYGLRFVQVSVLVSPADAPGAARALPVRLDFAPPAVKSKKNAPPEMTLPPVVLLARQAPNPAYKSESVKPTG